MEYKVFIKKVKLLSDKKEITVLDVIEFRRETGFLFNKYLESITKEQYEIALGLITFDGNLNTDSNTLVKDNDRMFCFKNLNNVDDLISKNNYSEKEVGFLMPMSEKETTARMRYKK
jgi:hypothetical protein